MNEAFSLLLAEILPAVLLIYAFGGMVLEKIKTSKTPNIIMFLGLVVAWIISAIIAVFFNDIGNIISALIGSIVSLAGTIPFAKKSNNS
jgi:hypothetical protein